MKQFYPLKTSSPTNLVQPVVHYLQTSESAQKAFEFRQNLTKITTLRNKVTALTLDQQPSLQQLQKYIPAVEMYCRYALLMAKHLNWNKDYGPTVDDLKLCWMQSFEPSINFGRSQIHFDIFCCFYNLGIMYFEKASILSSEDLIKSRKESIRVARDGYYIFYQMKTQYYPHYVNTGFSDTNYAHIEMLENLCLGLYYKNFFNLLKQDEYSKGIDKIANLAGLAQKHFYLAYQIGTQFFMKSCHISPVIKTQLLSLSYVEALYHDVMSNMKWAKYYQEEMDNDKENIKYLLAYQRKTIRLLSLGLQNQSVAHLLDRRPEEKKQLRLMLPQIEASLQTNLTRNKEIYKKTQIPEQQLPPLKQPPKQYLAKLVQPQGLKLNYDNPIASPFGKLMDNQSKDFMQELDGFIKNRLDGMQSAHAKLVKNVDLIYNNNYVNFYLNLQNNNNSKGMPESLRQKIQQIRANGGKEKVQMEIKIIRANEQQIGGKFKSLTQMLQQQQKFDSQKRQQFGNRWKRPPSTAINRSYISQIEVYTKKAQQANIVNQKLIEKYERLRKYVEIVDGTEQQIMKVIPKVEVTKFMQQNKKQFEKLKEANQLVRAKMEDLQMLAHDIRKAFENMDIAAIANKKFKQAQQANRQKVFDDIFAVPYDKIKKFNVLAKIIEEKAEEAAKISLQLNQRNSTNARSKKQFQEILGHFSEIASMFRELQQGTSFYTKLNDILAKIQTDMSGFLQARKIEAHELQESIRRKGGQEGPNLPSMYPNQQPHQNLGFYIPPPMQSSNNSYNFQNQFGSPSNMGDMLRDVMATKWDRTEQDIFKGQTHQSIFKK